MTVAPCKNCKDRFVSCHSTCNKYIEWKNSVDKEKIEIAKSKLWTQPYNKRL